MNFFYVILSICIAYLIGSLNFSVLISRAMFGKDVREKGSGNAGATNMGRVFGKTAGALTLLCDALKAAVAMAIGSALAGSWGLAAAGFFCLIGHCFPIFYHFKGGKGVSAGVVLAFAAGWKLGLAAVAGFIIGVAMSRKVSLGSILACVTALLAAPFVLDDPAKTVMIVFSAALILFRHSGNISRLKRGEEKEFHFGHAEKETNEGKKK